MAKVKLHNDPNAERLWKQCRNDADLKWLLEGVLSSRRPELGRILLISPVEFFGEVQSRLGKKLRLRFRLAGFPYLLGKFGSLSKSWDRMISRGAKPQKLDTIENAIAEWAAGNAQQARNLVAAAIIETVRDNAVLRALVTSDEPVTPLQVARKLQNFEALNWKPMEQLIEVFEPFLARSRSQRAINQITLNLNTLLQYSQPEIIRQDVILRSASHFMKLLRNRGVNEAAWRNLLSGLIDRNFVAPNTPVFLWCREFPHDGYVASPSLVLGPLIPRCPSCGKDPYAMASFAPAGALQRATELKDGLLGAAIGWHLLKRGIPFLHSHCEEGTEMDFVPVVRKGRFLIECKVFSVLVSAKRLARSVREAVRQLDKHAAILETQGSKLRGSICVVNLTDRGLAKLRRDGFSFGIPENRVISYDRFTEWLRHEVTR